MDTNNEFTVTTSTNEIIRYNKLVTTQNLRSSLWQFFGFPANNQDTILNQEIVICSICHSSVKHSKNTTNLSTHLANHHAEIYIKIKAENMKKSKRRKTNSSANLDGLEDGSSVQSFELFSEGNNFRIFLSVQV